MAPHSKEKPHHPSTTIDHGDHQHVIEGLPSSSSANADNNGPVSSTAADGVEATPTNAKLQPKLGDSKIPVTVLTGFLGAGKTTLLNNLLKDPNHGYRFAIIENELGAVGVDDELLKQKDTSPQIEKVEEEMIEVVNGCICCTVRGDLMSAMERLHEKHLSQKDPDTGRSVFDAVVIETTGLADPAPVVQTFFIEKSIQEKFRLDSVLTVVDSKQILTRLDEEKPEGVANEAVQQVLFADKIFLNKIDLVNEEELKKVKDRLKTLHPTATVIHCTNGVVPAVELVGLESFNLDRICDIVPDFLDDEFLEFNEKHDKAVSSVACTVEGELMTDPLSTWISQLMNEMGGERLYRYKGVLAVKGMDAKYIFQGVGMLFTGDFNKSLTWKPDEKRICKFVFIGKDLDPQMLREGFEKCKAPDTLRFKVGDDVEANVGKWTPGKVIKIWDEGNAYRIKLENDREVWAGQDVDMLIRKRQNKKKSPNKKAGKR